MTPAEILRAARALIEKPEHWTQGEDARSSTDRPVRPDSISATCWCLQGAIIREAADGGWTAALGLVRRAVGINNAVTWNDAPERTHTEVLAAFDRAIALAEQL